MGEDREKVNVGEADERERVLSPDEDVEGHKLESGRVVKDDDEDVEAHKLTGP
jgi:hypothetical protein